MKKSKPSAKPMPPVLEVIQAVFGAQTGNPPILAGPRKRVAKKPKGKAAPKPRKRR